MADQLRIRLSLDLMVPANSPVGQREYKQLMNRVEEYTRVVLVPDASIPIVKSAETHVTVHQHESTRQYSCRGCQELSDDGMNSQNG